MNACFAYTISVVPYNNDDSIEDVVRVPQVVKRAKCSDFEDHLQRKHAGEDDVADLQDISELLWLTERMRQVKTGRR